jgi:hypothetical protein
LLLVPSNGPFEIGKSYQASIQFRSLYCLEPPKKRPSRLHPAGTTAWANHINPILAHPENHLNTIVLTMAYWYPFIPNAWYNKLVAMCLPPPYFLPKNRIGHVCPLFQLKSMLKPDDPKIRSGFQARSGKDLGKKIRSFMRTLVKRPQHVRNYFKHSSISYTARVLHVYLLEQ